MPTIYDERGEPVGMEPEAYSPQQMPPQMQGPPQPAQVPFIDRSLQGRQDVIAGPRGGMIVPQGGFDAGPNPQDQRNINAYMEQMAKAGQIDKAQKDVEQALRFLGMRGVERDVQSGVPYHQALSKHLPYLSSGSPQQAQAYSKVIEANTPPPPLSMQNVGGVNVLRTPRGDRIVPQSAMARPPVTSASSIPFTNPDTGESIPGFIAVPSPGGQGFTIHRQQETEPRITPAQRRLELNDAIKDKQAEIEAVPWASSKDKEATAARAAQLKQLNAELEELRKQRPNLTKQKWEIGKVYKLPAGKNYPAGEYRKVEGGWDKP